MAQPDTTRQPAMPVDAVVRLLRSAGLPVVSSELSVYAVGSEDETHLWFATCPHCGQVHVQVGDAPMSVVRCAAPGRKPFVMLEPNLNVPGSGP